MSREDFEPGGPPEPRVTFGWLTVMTGLAVCLWLPVILFVAILRGWLW